MPASSQVSRTPPGRDWLHVENRGANLFATQPPEKYPNPGDSRALNPPRLPIALRRRSELLGMGNSFLTSAASPAVPARCYSAKLFLASALCPKPGPFSAFSTVLGTHHMAVIVTGGSELMSAEALSVAGSESSLKLQSLGMAWLLLLLPLAQVRRVPTLFLALHLLDLTSLQVCVRPSETEEGSPLAASFG